MVMVMVGMAVDDFFSLNEKSPSFLFQLTHMKIPEVPHTFNEVLLTPI